ncbi:MAG: hypothetical protein JWO47_15 [Candidatus Saccharibacteria bacterium]|nr:hypothetical protein [Candidatus Saccharibacteria bacterium]
MNKEAHTLVKFRLVNDALKKEFGTISFNGKFVFELNEDIESDVWQRVGIIPIEDNQRKVEVSDLFYYLNSRLPRDLRDSSSEKKLEYIKDTGLRVASDNFRLVLV